MKISTINKCMLLFTMNPWIQHPANKMVWFQVKLAAPFDGMPYNSLAFFIKKHTLLHQGM